MPVQIEPHPQGVVIAVRAQPGAKKNGITGEHDGALKVSVTQAPEKGKANKDEDKEGVALPIAISSHPDHGERIRFFREWSVDGAP